MKNYTLSVILVTKNAIINIESFIASYRKQAAKSKVQLIVVDGNSVDGTLIVLKNNIDVIDTLIIEEDSGIYDAMNKGLDCVTGDWVIFMGADDKFVNDFTLHDILEELILVPNRFEICVGLFNFAGTLKKNHFNYKLYFGNTLNHQSTIYKTILFQNKKFDVNFKIAADYKFNLECFKSRVKAWYTNKSFIEFGDQGLSSKEWRLAFEEMRVVRTQLFGKSFSLVVYIFMLIYFAIKKNVSK